jgi:hypothetical protein
MSQSNYRALWYPISRWRWHTHENFDDSRSYTHLVRRRLGARWGHDHRGRFSFTIFYDSAMCREGCDVVVGHKPYIGQSTLAIGTKHWWTLLGHRP